MAPRETKNNAYAKFWGDKQRTLWYVTVFSGVVNWGIGQLTLQKSMYFRMYSCIQYGI